MAGEWRAWALPEVSEQPLRRALKAKGLIWEECLHVGATGSLAKTMRRHATPAVSIANLLDVVVWAGMPADLAVEIGEFPSLSFVVDGQFDVFDASLKAWSNRVAGRNLNVGIRADLRLRRFLDHEAPDPQAGRLLRRSVRDLRRAVQGTATAGFEPDDFDGEDPVPRVALAAWKRLAVDVPELFRLRDDVWTDPTVFADGSTPHAAQLRRRVDDALAHLLGTTAERRSIVYHGFYFFTPHQWAWFQLLRAHEAIDQYFIVHDDGASRAFETWRRYFVERLDMPTPEPVPAVSVTSRASLLAAALSGAAVPAVSPGGPIQLVACRSSTEFVNLWRWQRIQAQLAGPGKPELYAAGSGDIERLVKRLDHDSAAGEVNLAELPIGQFLLALHGCIETAPRGEHRLVLDRSRLIDMVSSRLLDTGDSARDPSRHIAAFERAMPFFDDCSMLAEWVERAKVLERLVIAEVSALGTRMSGLTDRQRISVAASNPLRLVPWADLSDLEVTIIGDAIGRVAEMVEQVVSTEQRDPNRYLGWIRKQLERGMASLPTEELQAIEGKLRGVATAGVDDFDVEGIIDVVHMLLGRRAEFGLDGDAESDSVSARALRNLDALGFAPSKGDVHVANLVDSEFPAPFRFFRWPFSERLLKPGGPSPQASVDIARLREETAALSDLYLFWLALSGVSDSATLTLSWITELGTDLRNPSSLVTLIAALDHRSIVLKDAVGGLAVKPADQMLMLHLGAEIDAPAMRVAAHTDAEVAAAIELLDPIAASSAIVCPRRFALQWAMGPSGAFQTPHAQRMLYGNVQGALRRNPAWDLSEADAVRLTKDLWRQFTRGERMSSFYKRRVQPRGLVDWRWIYSLGGKKTGTDATSEAYQAVIDRRLPSPETIAPASDGVLPAPSGAVTPRICNMCPVKPRCAMQVSLKDD